MMRMEEEEGIKTTAQRFIRKNKEVLFKRFADDALYKTDVTPVTVFMAGSPGAGKTEVSVELVKQFTTPAVRIDADEIRAMCEGYTGANAHLFQSAASTGVDELYRHCLLHGYNVVVDGTFAHSKTILNIERSLAAKRKVAIYFVYQDPQVAWDFTKKREVVEHRRITNDTFIRGYTLSRLNVNAAKAHFGDNIELNLIIKNLTNDAVGEFHKNISSIDFYLKKIYTEDELHSIII